MEIRIREVLKEKNISIKEFARMRGISRQALSRQLRGNITVRTLVEIADTLGVPAWTLLVSEKKECSGFVRVGGISFEIRRMEEIQRPEEETKK